jgi:hypothetical protein
MRLLLLLLVAGVRVMGFFLPLDQKHGVFSNAHLRQVRIPQEVQYQYLQFSNISWLSQVRLHNHVATSSLDQSQV